MVNQGEVLGILKKEKLYEDELVKNIGKFLLSSLPNIIDLQEDEKNIIKDHLDKILKDSERHSRTFGELIDFTLDNGESNY